MSLADFLAQTGSTPKDHISPTQINMYLRCPAQYYFRYVEELRVPPSGAMTQGRAVHEANKVNYGQKVESGSDLPLSDLIDAYSDAFEESQEETDFEGEDPAEVKDEGYRLLECYYLDIARSTQPLLVEHKLEVDLNGITLLGYLDLMDDTKIIRDTKMRSRKPTDDLTQDVQLCAYSYAAHKAGIPDNGVGMDIITKTKTPKSYRLRAGITDDGRRRFERIAAGAVRGIKSDLYYPNPHNMMCSPKWCGYWDKCHKEW